MPNIFSEKFGYAPEGEAEEGNYFADTFGYAEEPIVEEPIPEDEPGLVESGLVRAKARGKGLLGNLFGAGQKFTDYLEEKLPMGGLVIDEQGVRWVRDMSKEKVTQPLESAEDYWKEGVEEVEEKHSWEDVKGKFEAGEYGQGMKEVFLYGMESGIASTPDMFAAVFSLPTYITARANEIGDDRAKNKGKAESDMTDYMEALPFATGAALLERIGAKGIADEAVETLGKEAMKAGFTNAAKEVAKGAGRAGSREAMTEFIQEGMIEYVGERYGTDAKMTLAEAIDRGLAGAVAGGVYGGVAGGVGAGVKETFGKGEVEGEPGPMQELEELRKQQDAARAEAAAAGGDRLDQELAAAKVAEDLAPEVEAAIKRRQEIQRQVAEEQEYAETQVKEDEARAKIQQEAAARYEAQLKAQEAQDAVVAKVKEAAPKVKKTKLEEAKAARKAEKVAITKEEKAAKADEQLAQLRRRRQELGLEPADQGPKPPPSGEKVLKEPLTARQKAAMEKGKTPALPGKMAQAMQRAAEEAEKRPAKPRVKIAGAPSARAVKLRKEVIRQKSLEGGRTRILYRKGDEGSSERLSTEVKERGGFTVDPKSGQPKNDGYAVGVGLEETVEGQATPEQIEAYRTKHAAVLDQPDHYLGAWFHEGKTYMDVSRVHPATPEGRVAAIAQGKQIGELAIMELGREDGLIDLEKEPDVEEIQAAPAPEEAAETFPETEMDVATLAKIPGNELRRSPKEMAEFTRKVEAGEIEPRIIVETRNGKPVRVVEGNHTVAALGKTGVKKVRVRTREVGEKAEGEPRLRYRLGDKMKLNAADMKEINAVLNDPNGPNGGWRGYRKEVALRVDMETGGESFNYDLYEDTDLADMMLLKDLKGVEIEVNADGYVSLDIWLYKGDELVSHATVYITKLGDFGTKIGLGKPDQASILRAAVAAAVEKTKAEEKKDGRDFKDFFSDVTKGVTGKSSTGKDYQPVIAAVAAAMQKPGSPIAQFSEEYAKHRGNFDDHIAFSIPGFKEVQMAVGKAISSQYGKDHALLDIGASEGSFAKAVAARSGGMNVVAMDPNPDMAKSFADISQVPGAEYSMTALGTATEEGQLAWMEGDTEIRFYDPEGQKFDVVHEAMVFQFISNERGDQIARTKELMKDDGVLIVEEKVKTDNWDLNEAKKNKYKGQFFDKRDMDAKSTAVLEGMNENMVPQGELEAILRDKFDHVVQFWDSGNFKGYMASDSKDKLDSLVYSVGNTSSEYANTDTPRVVESRKAAAEAENLRRWFGSSKVVDDTGAPRVVFHGTDAEFEAFIASEPKTFVGTTDIKGIYFTDDMQKASGYARPSGRRAPGGGRRKIIRAYLKIENPLYISSAVAAGQARGLSFGDAKREAMKALTPEHDGVIFSGDNVNPGEYIVFDSRQVKSAIDNRGTYDPADPRIRYKRTDNQPISRAQAENDLEGMLSKIPLLDAKILENEQDPDLPADIAAEMKRARVSGVKGVYDIWTGSVYVFAGNHNSVEEIQSTILHEGVAHKGLRFLLADDLPALLRDVYENGNQADIRRIARKYGLDLNKEADRMIAAEEYIAHMAESGIESTVFERVIAVIRQALRELGIAREWTDNDIRALLRRARETLRGKPLSKIMIASEVEIAETGEVLEIEETADVVTRRARKRRSMIEKLRECVS